MDLVAYFQNLARKDAKEAGRGGGGASKREREEETEMEKGKKLREWAAYFISPEANIDTHTRAIVLIFLCLLVSVAKFASLVQVIASVGPSYLSVGVFCFWMQMMFIPFLIKRSQNLYLLTHYTLALLYVGVLFSMYSVDGYMLVNCTVFPILPIFATFLFRSFKDSFAWCILLLITNVSLYFIKADWHPGSFPSMPQYTNFLFFANIVGMSITAMIGGVFNFSSDLKQKELEQERDKAQELSKIKSEFTANVSHEIRTPLVAVIGLSELLAKDAMLSSDQRYLINTIYSASLHLDNLVNNVLNFSKTEANMTQLDRTPFDVSELVEETLLYFSAMAESCSIRLLSFIDPISTDGLCAVIGDPHRIQQILQNLVANAIKFCAESAQGEVLITLDTVPSKKKDFEGRWYRFSVADNGIGMSKAGLQRLFQPFSQCDSSTTRRYGGTGLGLVICKQLCTLLGGEIEVDSEEGKGTTITFTIPLQLAEDPESENSQLYPRTQRKKETAAAAEAAAHAAADAADAAEEAALEASHAATKAAEETESDLTPQGRRAASATASAAKQTAHAAKATADAAHTTADAALAAAEAFAPADSPVAEHTPQSPPAAKRAQQGLHVQTNFSPRTPYQPNHSPLRQPMQLTKPSPEQAHSFDALMRSLEFNPAAGISEPITPRKGNDAEEEEDEDVDIVEKEPLIQKELEADIENKARALSSLAKDLVASTSNWTVGRRQSEDAVASAPESPFSRQMRTTLDDIQQILRQTEYHRTQEMRMRKSERRDDMRHGSLPPLMRVESAPSPDAQREVVSPRSELTRHGRSKSVTSVSGLYSPQVDPNLSPPNFGTRMRMDRRVSGGSVSSSDRTPMFSPDFQKILAKSQEFWTSTGSLSGELRRGTTGYLEPIGDSRVAWARIREGMRASAASPQGDAVCVLAGSHAAREVIKASLLFRGITNTEVMDGDEYAKLLKSAHPPHFRVVIAEAELFAHMSPGAASMRNAASSEGDGLAEILNPAVFDPRISTRYVLLISCKYHRFGKFIEFSVPPVEGGTGEDTVKVVFCANNPVRRSSLAQSLLACVVTPAASEDTRKAAEGARQQDASASPPQPSRSNLRILLCEDNLVNIEVLTRQLKRLGYTNCDIKHNGADGIKAFKEKEYDIVLMDCQMPVLDGYEATKEIRKLEQKRGAKKRVPIVALTASAMPEEREKGMKSGMDNYLSKPIQLAVLQNILESVQANS